MFLIGQRPPMLSILLKAPLLLRNSAMLSNHPVAPGNFVLNDPLAPENSRSVERAAGTRNPNPLAFSMF